MTVRLRPHHLLCVLTYSGRGYTPRFVANLNRVVERLSAGEPVQVIAGRDDICAGFSETETADAHCTRASVTDRDARALAVLSARMARPVRVGAELRLRLATVGRLRAAFADGAFRDACAGCEWVPQCTDTAAAGYPDARLQPAD